MLRPLLLLLTALAVLPARAQISASVAVGYLELEEVGRWGVAGAVQFPLTATHAVDLVPSFEYFYGKWSVDSDTTARDIYAVSLDAHGNLPALADRLRPFVGAGLTYAGHGDESAFGLDLTTGLYLRVVGWRVFPYGQVTYRVLPDFETLASLDTYFLRGGLRVML